MATITAFNYTLIISDGVTKSEKVKGSFADAVDRAKSIHLNNKLPLFTVVTVVNDDNNTVECVITDDANGITIMM